MKSAHSLSSTFAIAVLAGAALSLAALTITASAQSGRQRGPQQRTVLASGTCVTTATKYKISNTLTQTNSTSYVNVVDMALAFTQGGASASCVIVSFSSEASGVMDERMQVQLLLDNAIACEPNNTFFVNNSTDLADRAVNFVCPNVAPGSHAVRMQFQSVSGGTVALVTRTMLVHYVK